jgi:hypothetical protein
MQKIDKNKFLVMRALVQHYNPEEAIAWSATARELAKQTGLKENQCLTVGRRLADARLARSIQSSKTIKSARAVKKVPVLGFALNRAGSLEFARMQEQLAELGVEL